MDTALDERTRMLMALQLALVGLERVESYTSKHCSDCRMNRYRAEQIGLRVRRLVGVGAFQDLDKGLRSYAQRVCSQVESDARQYCEQSSALMAIR